MHINSIPTGRIFIILFFLATAACQRNTDSIQETPGNDTSAAEGILRLSPRQLKHAVIITGSIENIRMGSRLKCSGIIETSPQHIADVTVPVGGQLKSFPYNTGDFVKAGQPVAVLEHPDYIKIQQEFLEATSQWDYFREDFKRQGELTVENAASIKTMQQSQAEFKAIEVKMVALKKQLKLLGIHADSLTVENISSTVTLFAPISGYIANIQVNMGKYVDPQDKVCEILNMDGLSLKLFIPEKDISRIRVGQSLEFTLAGEAQDEPQGNPEKELQAVVKGISPVLDESMHAFVIRALIQKAGSRIIPGMAVTAYIQVPPHSVYALPRSAIMDKNGGPAIFVKIPGGYKRVPVQTGISENDRIEVTGMTDALKQVEIVIQGADFLEDVWKKR